MRAGAYAEDHKAEGMLFAKLLLSPMPHARVTRIDTSAALAMPGVKAILTMEDLPGVTPGQTLGEGVVSTTQGELPLTMEPVYEGEPILAVAAVDELTAAEAIEKIQIDFEPLPFNVDALASLRPGSANARVQGNTWLAPAAPAAGRGGAPAAAAAGAAPAAAAPAAEGRGRGEGRGEGRGRRGGAPPEGALQRAPPAVGDAVAPRRGRSAPAAERWQQPEAAPAAPAQAQAPRVARAAARRRVQGEVTRWSPAGPRWAS